MRKRRKSYKPSLLDLTPMIDVLFLLIIFFMTSSTLVEQQAIPLEVPKSVTGQQKAPEPLVISIKKDGSYYVNNDSVNLDQLSRQLQRAVSQEGLKSVLIRGDKLVPYDNIIQVFDRVKLANVDQIELETER